MTDDFTRQRTRTAIVTGGAGGIGAATAGRLAGDGFAVGVVDRREEDCAATVDAITASGGRATGVGADVADEAAVTGAVARIAAALGPPTVLVNNAGFAHRSALVDTATEQWDAVLGVNLRGAFFATRAVVPHMTEAGWGRVVNVSSVSAAGDAGRIGYASAKAGLIGFTKTLALELGPHGITANALAPGFVVSAMTRESARRLGLDFEEYRSRAERAVPVGRVGQPEDVAHAASFLVSDGAGFVSGQVLHVAGGPVG
ncbi:3-oxoacyl-ACP reductase FabG [Streptomyces albiaxialis]|uniref:3-oxoacyl-ACP reductase FabG n=1 Tax=Streptomyces albiaxialis TaxID=329523 RepID=A0ABN2W0I9_9ACTN